MPRHPGKAARWLTAVAAGGILWAAGPARAGWPFAPRGTVMAQTAEPPILPTEEPGTPGIMYFDRPPQVGPGPAEVIAPPPAPEPAPAPAPPAPCTGHPAPHPICYYPSYHAPGPGFYYPSYQPPPPGLYYPTYHAPPPACCAPPAPLVAGPLPPPAERPPASDGSASR